jgi:hypothetical protein
LLVNLRDCCFSPAIVSPAASGKKLNFLVLYFSQCQCVAGRMSDQREQDSNPGGWRKGRFIMLAGQHPVSLQKWHQPCSPQLWGFYAAECRNKQVGRTKADVAVSLSLGGYNISH